jgi:alpha-tubulin suppressor-like RCC1 family protein
MAAGSRPPRPCWRLEQALGGELLVGGVEPDATSSGAFIDELIGFASPGGNVPAGTYDVVFDTCQDGFLTTGDTVFEGAITVVLPETLPPVSPSIAALKEKARLQYVNWMQTHTLLTAIFAADKAKAIVECLLAPTPSCLLNVLAVIFDEGGLGARQGAKIQELVAGLVMNVAKNHGAIWKDPPDADFAQLPTLDRPVYEEPALGGQPLYDAVIGLVPDLADEAALTEALLHAIERYQGAQAAGDGDWALVQARAVRDLAGTLADRLTASTAVTDLRDAVADRAEEITANHAAGAAIHNRIRQRGFTPDEGRVLANQGFSTAEIVAIEGTYVTAGYVVLDDAADLLARLDEVAAGRTELAAALADTVTGWDEVVTALEASGTRTLPTAVVGGPYVVVGGDAVQLDGSASTGRGGASLTAYEWDLDGDGSFDDAAGATPTVTFATGGSHLVSLRVSDSAGNQGVAHAHVAVSGGNLPPTITSFAPAAAAAATVGETLELTVVADDPEGDPLSYVWTMDGQPVGDGTATLVLAPDASVVGPHAISVVVSDGVTAGTGRAWRVAVTMPDGDGDGWTETSDCDDTRADVSPGRFERLGNGLDDDCDPSTPDAPVGGLTGEVWSWGASVAVGTGTYADQYLPVPVTGLEDVTDVQTSFRRVFARLASGEVRAWGLNFAGALGDGTTTERRSPVTVVGVGGQGVLSGVVQVSSEHDHTLAVRSDGTVVAWGSNNNGQLGDGSTVASRPHPVVVVDAAGDPITDVVAVEAGASSSYALRADGTVLVWGVLRCMADTAQPPTQSNHAVPLTLLGDGVVQLSASHALLLARKADGSAWSCGGDADELDRGKTNPTVVEMRTPMPMVSFGPGSDVIDVSAAGSGGLALTADGTVWGWGHNINGFLDLVIAPNYRVWTPVPMPLPEGPPIVDIDTDYSCHPLAQRADGAVLTWGCNNYGGGGIGTYANPMVGVHELAIDGAAVKVSSSNWNGVALVRPLDDPDLPRPAHWIEASAQDATIGEATGGTVDVTLSEPAPADLTVTWALEGGDTGEAIVPAGATVAAVPVAVTDDDLDEHDEELAFHVLAVSHGVKVVGRTAVVTVVDDDAPPAVDVAMVSVDEGDTSLTDAAVAVTLPRPSGKDVTVTWTTADDTATSGVDYAAASGEVGIPAGATETIIHVAVHGDDAVEPTETISIVLSDPVNATLGGGVGGVTIVDDEALAVSVTSPVVTEGTGGTTTATFAVTLTSPPVGETVTVPWHVAGVTAEVPADVESASGTLTFDAATTHHQVTVAVVADAVVEPTEVFRLVVGAPIASSGRAVLPPDPTTAVIVDDDEVTEEPGDGFEFDGFYEPVADRPAVNVMQAGRAVPLRFSLGGDHGLDVFAAGYPASTRIPCDSDTQLETVEETVTPGASDLTYDPVEDTYHYVWQTQRAWKNQCRRLVLRFTDGTEATADFRFR